MFPTPVFQNRRHGGVALASALSRHAGEDLIVLALPRGGVPVAFEVARALHAPLDVFVVRKLGLPGREELAMGAIASGGAVVLNRDVIETLSVDTQVIEAVAEREAREVVRREHLYRNGRPPPHVQGKSVIVVDDGLATGATMQAAVAALRQQGPAKITVGVPIGSPRACASMHAIADQVMCVRTAEPFRSLGLWYEDFSQTTDGEVRALLAEAATSYALESRAPHA